MIDKESLDLYVETGFEFDDTPEVDHCKGLVFRGIVNRYIGSDGSFNEKRSLKLLKKKSCNACYHCGSIMDDFCDHVIEGWVDFNQIEHGHLYTFVCVIDGGFEEIVEEWHYELENITEDTIINKEVIEL